MKTSSEWYRLESNQVFQTLQTSQDGLSSEEAKVRLKKYGYNELKFRKESEILRLLRQFCNPLIYILLVAAFICTALSLFLGKEMWPEVMVISGVILINAVVGFVQEGKAEKEIEALRKLMVLECTVLRDGKEKTLPAKELVPGDMVRVESGNRVPADLRLILAKNLTADESALTGESVPVRKNIFPIDKPNLSLSGQTCLLFSGTFITHGSGKGIVVRTGEQTEFGKIAKLIKETVEIHTPLERKFADFSKFLVKAILVIGLISFGFGIWFGYDLIYSFLASISLIVAAIPEMLPPVVTILLAFAATVMATRKAFIRRLPAAETLGCTTVICSDKTGTLTKNQMTVVKVFSGRKDYEIAGVGYEPEGRFLLEGKEHNPILEGKELIEVLKAGYFCNNASLITDEQGWNIVGDPTEGALVISATKAGLTEKLPRIDEIPFDPQEQFMATLHRLEESNLIYVKGAPEKILSLCKDQLIDSETQPLEKELILEKANQAAEGALRVLAMASKFVPSEKNSIDPEDIDELTFLGLQGMIDPPREEVMEAIKKCKKAGIRVIMITGDHAKTAKAIAEKLGIPAETVLTGEDLSGMNDEKLYQIVNEVSVYARASPKDKFRIATQLQKRGQVVAMTGDGVNDAPALKAADIGIAMGQTGTEVAKEASDMILSDDNFVTIVEAVKEGRHAWENLRKVILYTLPTNGGQLLLILGAVLLVPVVPLFATALPLAPIHILWVNMADSIFLTLPLIKEPEEKGLLDLPPRNPKEKIANKLFFERVGPLSIFLALTGFGIFWFFGSGISPLTSIALIPVQTATLTAVIFFHLGFLFSARKIFDSVFTFSPFSNKWILLGIGACLLTLLAIIYLPFLNSLFRTAPFPSEWWPVIILASLPGLAVIEIDKLLRKIKFK